MDRKSVMYVLLVLLFTGIFQGCQNKPVKMSSELCGRWKSKLNNPDVMLASDSAGAYAIVYHQTFDGRICPIRYPLYLSSRNAGTIQAEGRIIIYYDSLKHILLLSPGGEYAQ